MHFTEATKWKIDTFFSFRIQMWLKQSDYNVDSYPSTKTTQCIKWCVMCRELYTKLRHLTHLIICSFGIDDRCLIACKFNGHEAPDPLLWKLSISFSLFLVGAGHCYHYFLYAILFLLVVLPHFTAYFYTMSFNSTYMQENINATIVTSVAQP